MIEPPTNASAPDCRRGRRTLVLIALVALAPIVAAVLAYYVFKPSSRSNYGTLVAAPAPEIVGTTLRGAPFRLSRLQGKWLLIVIAGGGCDPACQRELYATRQARTIQGRERERVLRLWLITDDAPPNARVLAEHPDLMVARVPPGAAGVLPAGDRAIYLLDPLGNLVLHYPEAPDIKRLARDLTRLLQASSIG